MANGDDDGGLLVPLMFAGAFVLGYVYRKELNLEAFYDDVTAFLKAHNLWPFDPVECTKTCLPNEHLQAVNCTCVPNICTKTCPTGQHIDSNCQCVNDGGGGSGTGNTIGAFAGDWGAGRNSNWQKVVAVMNKFHPNFIGYSGDLSYTNPNDFKKVIDALKPAISLGANGNHDGGSYASLFSSYSNSVANVGNCSIMLLNTENGSSAISYARSNFNKMTNKWKIVVFHKPIYTIKSDHGPDEGKIKALVPDFVSHGIQLVVQGHNHNYQRFAKTNGVTYVVAGTGGESHYPIGGNCSVCPSIVKTSGSFGALIGNFGASTANMQFVNTNNSVEDSFTL